MFKWGVMFDKVCYKLLGFEECGVEMVCWCFRDCGGGVFFMVLRGKGVLRGCVNFLDIVFYYWKGE